MKMNKKLLVITTIIILLPIVVTDVVDDIFNKTPILDIVDKYLGETQIGNIADMIISATETDGVWIKEDLNAFQGLILSGDEGVTVTLYSGFSEDAANKVEPYKTEGNTQYYANVSGKYRVKATRSGYTTQYENIYVSEEEAVTKMEKHYSLVSPLL
mgnify:CR=1 FL=1